MNARRILINLADGQISIYLSNTESICDFLCTTLNKCEAARTHKEKVLR